MHLPSTWLLCPSNLLSGLHVASLGALADRCPDVSLVPKMSQQSSLPDPGIWMDKRLALGLDERTTA